MPAQDAAVPSAIGIALGKIACRSASSAASGKVGIEGDVVIGRDPEGLNCPLGELDFRHARTCSRNVLTLSFLTRRRFVEESWKPGDESGGVVICIDSVQIDSKQGRALAVFRLTGMARREM